MSPYWTDPIKRLNDPSAALFFNATAGAPPYEPPANSEQANQQALPLRSAATVAAAALPPMNATYRGVNGAQDFLDGVPPGSAAPAGALTFASPPGFAPAVWLAISQDDLILSGVRSFDVKALETRYYVATTAGIPEHPPTTQYVDLGYGAVDGNGDGINDFAVGTPPNVPSGVPNYVLNTLTTLAHEGRMPPLMTDFRQDAQWPQLRPNIGDNQTGVVRLRRVWDSWSTTYSRTPDPINPVNRPPFRRPGPAVVPGPLPGASEGASDPDPGRRPREPADEDADDPFRLLRSTRLRTCVRWFLYVLVVDRQ